MSRTAIFTGYELAARLLARTRREVAELGRAPVGVTLHDPVDVAAGAYLRRQMAMAHKVGVSLRSEEYAIDPEGQIRALAAVPGVDAVMALTPLPRALTPVEVARLIGPEKDADGQHPLHAGALLLGDGATRLPPTALAALLCAREILGDLRGAEVVLVGASRLIGRPLSMLLADAGATVTLCHAETRDLAAHTRCADLIVTAAGVPGLIGRDHVAEGGLVLDLAVVGTGAGLVGDADLSALDGHAALISHVPDGVGPVTTACLISIIAAAAGCAPFSPGEDVCPGFEDPPNEKRPTGVLP
ncbi:bifunctional 5,10-methylenetetrahydrofolate dehydrogenase/5,10-methenyltetrahydrofolate cyclohydrolase [Pseudoruegeria sp. HB172150]|uniref:bifunctional 5,10-methylenetetrahydrofolate dehydrogenase/5,10-methenyltetrahydrofolate cyclohydrolase n=1 Tax=Pseudoruegeria sp. HB172150 TaxID=2721164 RepID=UPI001551BB6E|nr:bifunctional 5,10-methylenetetrahydrofolate dehydrogenase/5,10-methenyltetrahydrofolate cyclohydrolase [Pseudoruegeria sp. HB172150]